MFENYASQYDKESFTQGTLGECDFIETELNHDQSLKIIDVGCGTGRHAIELTKRGYCVTGIDLSASQLEKAREKAKAEGLSIAFLQLDARKLPFENKFDVAIMLCEGGFPLMETDEMNFEILQSVSMSLKSPAKFIFTTLNALYPLHHSLNDFYEEGITKEGAHYQSHHFDVMTLRDHNTTTLTDDDGNEMELACNERYYMPSEMTWLLTSLGFRKVGLYGAKLGAFSREDALTTDDFEMLVIAER